MTRVVVCGGGAVAHALAGVLGALPGTEVRVLTRRPADWGNCLLVEHGEAVVAGAFAPTGDAACVADAELVLVAAPAFAHRPIIEAVAPHVGPAAWIGALPAVGRFDEAVAAILPSHHRVFGSLRSPYNARVRRYGESVVVSGIAPRLDLLAPDGLATEGLGSWLEGLLSMPVRKVGPLLLAAAAPGGTVFHAARMHELLASPDPSRERFYRGWGEAASRAYLRMDAELSGLRAALGCDAPGLDAASHYGTDRPAALARRIRSLRGLPDIATPFVGREIDTGHRFVREDLPFGMDAARRLAADAGVSIPVIACVRNALTAAIGRAGS